MRIAVLGGGTAGTMAAVHVTWAFPDAELLHVVDSRIPILGVGESSTPAIPRWLAQVGGPGHDELRARCGSTLKRAGRFERWGTRHASFLHRFQPAGELAYHFDAGRLVEVLGERIRGPRLDAHVTAVESTGRSATVVLDGGARLPCDYVLDARGFPPQDDPESLPLSCIPTNAALVQFASSVGDPEVTRNVARPHGWVFVIPLADRTGTGYVHHATITPRAEVEADYEAFLREEGMEPVGERRRLRFPSFARRTTFDGAVMRVGNAASFTEPLEALSLGTAIFQLRSFTQWVRAAGEAGPRRAPEPVRLRAFNEGLVSFARRNAIFLAWHYCAGSPWDTPFWAHARARFAAAGEHPELAADVARFHEFVDVARELPIDDLGEITDREAWNRRVFPRLRLHRPYGNFSELNVAQVGHGIGVLTR
jgi:tryptophan 7-halogenase